jgi:hypothetical protein
MIMLASILLKGETETSGDGVARRRDRIGQGGILANPAHGVNGIRSAGFAARVHPRPREGHGAIAAHNALDSRKRQG